MTLTQYVIYSEISGLVNLALYGLVGLGVWWWRRRLLAKRRAEQAAKALTPYLTAQEHAVALLAGAAACNGHKEGRLDGAPTGARCALCIAATMMRYAAEHAHAYQGATNV